MEGITSQQFREAYERIQEADHVLLSAHQKPDGDTSGAALALWQWLRSIGKEAYVFCKDPIPDQYHFLPGADQLVTDPAIFEKCHDVVITCDSGDLEYAGIADHVEKLPRKPVVLNFDHHISNKFFADVNLVNTDASSTAEVVAKFFEVNGIELSKEMAICLMTGVFTDTGGFSNAATNDRSLQIASTFVKHGASIKDIREAVMENKNLPAMRLWGKVLTRLKTNKYSFAYTYILRQDLLELGLDEEAAEGLSNYLSHIKDVNAVIVLFEREDDMIKASMRTYHDHVDLSKLASMLGGGGHQKAAGFTIPGRLVELKEGVQVVG